MPMVPSPMPLTGVMFEMPTAVTPVELAVGFADPLALAEMSAIGVPAPACGGAGDCGAPGLAVLVARAWVCVGNCVAAGVCVIGGEGLPDAGEVMKARGLKGLARPFGLVGKMVALSPVNGKAMAA